MNPIPIIFLVLIVGTAAVLITYYYWQEYRMRQYAAAVARRWRAEGRDVRFEPTVVEYYGDEPLRSHARRAATRGVLGIADRDLIFVPFGNREEQPLPFDVIRWIGTHTVEVSQGDGTTTKNALVVHYEAAGEWHMGVWVMSWPNTVAGVLAKLNGQLDPPLFGQREDYGPETAECLLQDVYGEWHPADEARRRDDVVHSPFEGLTLAHGPLYLAPDRLVFNRYLMIHFAQLRRIEVYERGGLLNRLNPFAEDLLRIEYALPDEPRGLVVGFLVRSADQWGKTLAARAQVPYEVREGRKKKEEA